MRKELFGPWCDCIIVHLLVSFNVRILEGGAEKGADVKVIVKLTLEQMGPVNPFALEVQMLVVVVDVEIEVTANAPFDSGMEDE